MPIRRSRRTPRRWRDTVRAMGRSTSPPVSAVSRLLLAALVSALPALQAARAAESSSPRIFQCVLPDGRKVTSDKPIAECMNAGKPQRELNKDGSEKAIVEAPPTEDEKAERDRIRRQREAE